LGKRKIRHGKARPWLRLRIIGGLANVHNGFESARESAGFAKTKEEIVVRIAKGLGAHSVDHCDNSDHRQCELAHQLSFHVHRVICHKPGFLPAQS
jgi:hypothetical protein